MVRWLAATSSEEADSQPEATTVLTECSMREAPKAQAEPVATALELHCIALKDAQVESHAEGAITNFGAIHRSSWHS